MSTEEHRSERRTDAGTGRDHDGGFILATLGLLIIPIVVFTALAVDVSSWYSRATELQRTADAAALAGVVWMPNITQAQTEGQTVLANNNVVNGSGGLTVTMGPGIEENSFKVCVTDGSAPQYFSSVFTGPESLTRCGTAKYNLPLELGSPLNYYGGNSTADVGSYVESTNNTSPDPGQNWNTANNIDQPPNSRSTGCWYHYNGSDYHNAVVRQNRRYVWGYGNGRGSGLPRCTYDHTVSQNPIPASKSPNFWAAISGPGMYAPNGDAHAPRCASSGNCGTTDNTMYRPEGYWYSITPSSSGSTSLQIFDADQSSTSRVDTGDTRYGGSVNQHTRYTLYDSGATPYDQSDDVAVSGCTLTLAGLDDAYKHKWIQLCAFNGVAGHRYYLNVKSSDNAWSQDGDTYNGYALRVVAGSFPASCLSPTLPQRNNVDCYGTGSQPRISGYGDMEMYNGIPSGTPTQFFLADVKNEYRGKTLVIELWDPGDGQGNSYITVMKPGSTVSGTPQQGCRYRGETPTGSVVLGPYTPSGDCTIQTTNNGNNAFQNRWVHIEIDLPSDYSCSETVSDPTVQGGSCWWQIKYTTTNSLNDYTTWKAYIQGDPVRLVR